MAAEGAGLRTNILIAIGSTLFTVMSIDLSRGSGGDPTRIAAQIVTGIGFLGAGAIMRTGAASRVDDSGDDLGECGGRRRGRRRRVPGRDDRDGCRGCRAGAARSGGTPARSPSADGPSERRRYWRRTFRGGRGGAWTGSAGRPASIHAAVIIEAASVIDSASRCSRTGRTLPEQHREVAVVVDLPSGDRRLVGVEHRLHERKAATSATRR